MFLNGYLGAAMAGLAFRKMTALVLRGTLGEGAAEVVWTELNWEFHVVEMECMLWTRALNGGKTSTE